MRYWCRFYLFTAELPSFEYHGPWWITGTTDSSFGEQSVVCAAVVADSEDAARTVLRKCFDPGHGLIEWSFVEQRPDDWEPFTDRFPRRDWMKWPFPLT